MIKKLLVANRGEIACRIFRTAKRMGIKTVAVYSEADVNAAHVHQADEAIYIGQSPATLSYLNQESILEAIKVSGADAVHPGFGFLSENASFASLLEKNNIIFVGPSAKSIVDMGDKIRAKKIAQKSGVNTIPGYLGAIRSVKEALKIANKIGYPIMLKAAAGGGGKGIRVVKCDDEMAQAFQLTKNEAKNSFLDERTFIEKYIENPRHIEIQLLADKYGNYVCLGERECSIQRHHQKVIEESPSTFVDHKLRQKMYTQSVSLAKNTKYYSAGTIEFIVDQKKNFYFLEMNTRLQVEHPVTELITGIDIVEQMINIADGRKLSFAQKDVVLNGWAIESRICAEDPTCGFLPSTGQITTYREPEASDAIRIDTAVYEGGEVSMFYDSMIAKLCTYAPSRGECIEIMNNALGSYVIEGISHNITFLQAIVNSSRFLSGDISTSFISEEYKDGFTGSVLRDEDNTVILSAASFVFSRHMKRNSAIHANNQMYNQQRTLGTRWVVMLDQKSYPVTVRPIDHGYKISFENRRLYITSNWTLGNKRFQCTINGKEYNLQVELDGLNLNVSFNGLETVVRMFNSRAAELYKFMKQTDDQSDESDLIANISGVVSDIKVAVGDTVSKGQALVVLEAMKMENILVSPAGGVVRDVPIAVGEAVMSGDVLVNIESE